ncbi:hypothetical protein EGT74_06625 [Chitinophaga lutea]|uniref:Uncharacterized protein n=1 Tax=Chitinophaga lutea TaxID=2488634 RepID=A0A3N4QB32_9BACT|nr:hypothetical protein [Chitinophaga lutea]RPE13200.1 hypothetical protein EGT74_06625 [Chitinophaga lutea]
MTEKERLLKEISEELAATARLNGSLLVITGMDAISEKRLELWVQEMHHNLSAGKSILFNAIFSDRMTRLVKRWAKMDSHCGAVNDYRNSPPVNYFQPPN